MRIYRVPLELLLTLPLVVICLYFIFRWRKFGEDAFTWNHEYFQLACSFGIGVCVAGFIATLLPEPAHIALFWLTAFIGLVVGLSYWGSQELVGAAVLSLLLVIVGTVSMPVPRAIHRFLFGTPQPAHNDILAGVPRRSFAISLPDGWHEIPDKSPRTYTRQAEGSGVLQISFQPPPTQPITAGADAEKELLQILDSIGKSLDLGRQLSVSHETCASGIMAFADYQSEQHGLMRFWLIPTEVTVFATYTDGQPSLAEHEIAEAHATIKAAKFE